MHERLCICMMQRKFLTLEMNRMLRGLETELAEGNCFVKTSDLTRTYGVCSSSAKLF